MQTFNTTSARPIADRINRIRESFPRQNSSELTGSKGVSQAAHLREETNNWSNFADFSNFDQHNG
jgi:hypothetical protein